MIQCFQLHIFVLNNLLMHIQFINKHYNALISYPTLLIGVHQYLWYQSDVNTANYSRYEDLFIFTVNWDNYKWMHTNTNINTHRHTHTHIYTNTYTQAQTHAHTQIHTHTHTHTLTYITQPH